MATRQSQVLKTKGTHEVGNLNNITVRTINGGAIVATAAVDNFTLVELGFNANGERTCSQINAVTDKSYLIASPEDRLMNESLVDFYNEVGDYARIVILDQGVRFDTSAFSLNAGGTGNGTAVTSVANGLVAHFDPTTKKYILSNVASAHGSYATAKAKFLVVSNEDDMNYSCGKPLVRLEVQES